MTDLHKSGESKIWRATNSSQNQDLVLLYIDVQGRSNGPKGAGAKIFGSRLWRSLLLKPQVLCSIKASCQKRKNPIFTKID